MFNGIKNRLSDKDFLNMSEEDQMKSMEAGMAPESPQYDKSFKEPSDKGVMADLKKEGFSNVDEFRDEKANSEMLQGLSAGLSALSKSQSGNSKPMEPFRVQAAPRVEARDNMSSLRQQVLANIMSR